MLILDFSPGDKYVEPALVKSYDRGIFFILMKITTILALKLFKILYKYSLKKMTNYLLSVTVS